jgi:hypothetical protein
VLDLARLSPIAQATGPRFDQSIAPVGGLQQHRTAIAIAGALPLVKGQHHSPSLEIGKLQTLCRDRIRSSESRSLYLKHYLVNMFVAQKAFAFSAFENYAR